MASPQDQAETVKAAVASVATCSPATIVLLRELLLSNDIDETNVCGKDSKTSKNTRATKAAPNVATSRTAGSKRSGAGGKDKPELSVKERALLATHIINVTLKSLGDAAKESHAATPKTPGAGKEDKTIDAATARKRIRRSNSAPMTPMQPRCLNRVSTSPEVTKKPAPPKAPETSTGCLCTVECARVAFSTLRALQTSTKITLPELQLEAGLSSLVGKLISLGLIEHALKELRVLKRNLVDLTGTEQKRTTKPTTGPQTLASLLDFQSSELSGQILNLVVATQMQVLRLLASLKRPADIEAALPFLRQSNKTSPVNLLLVSAQASGTDKARAARQLETISQLLLSLAPSISTTADSTATEVKLSIQPATALELQTIALRTRLCWWRLAGHNSDVDKDILSPLSKCIAAYARRTQQAESITYKTCLAAFDNVYEQASEQGLQPQKVSKSPLVSIYQSLGRLARDSALHSEAVTWAEKVGDAIDRSRDSAAKCFSTSASLLAHRLRVAWKYPAQDVLLKEVLEGLQGSLRGDSSELDELLESLVLVRKSATYVLVGNVSEEDGKPYRPKKETAELLETFVSQLPRFCLRWLGKRPSSTENTKEFLRFEQRRVVVGGSTAQILDSALMLAKMSIEKKESTWDKLDSLLQDCLILLEHVGDLNSADPSNSYSAKISHLYYMQHSIFIAAEPKPTKNGTTFAHALKALRRSIDCVRHRSSKEREKAQIVFKLERIIELYRQAGKSQHALESLQTLRRILVEDGVLASVAQALKTMPPQKAWSSSLNVQSMAWSIRSIAKLEKVWTDWTIELDEPERLAALEFALDCNVSKSGGIDPADPSTEALLTICSVERFPVRRLGILLRLLTANMGNEAHLETMRSQVEEAASISHDADLGEDADLKNCLPHMKALSMSILALARPSPDYGQLKSSVATWRHILDLSKEPNDLASRIDDVSALLEHLQSVADCARLANQNDLLLKTLQVAADLGQQHAAAEAASKLQISGALALQLTNMGQSEQAATILQQAQHEVSTISPEEQARFLLSQAEYFIEIGHIEKAGELLQRSKNITSGVKLSSRSRLHRMMIADASLLCSAVAIGRGDAPCALTHARNATRLLFQEWGRLEQQITKGTTDQSSPAASTNESKLDASLNESAEKNKDTSHRISGPEAWRLAHPVLRGLLFLSNIYAHLGMYQETVYYAEQALKVAQAADSEAYLAECGAWLSAISARAGKLDDALKSVNDVRPRLNGGDYSSKLINLCCQLGNAYREVRDFESEGAMLEAADAMVRKMAGASDQGEAPAKAQSIPTAEKRATKVAVRERPAVATRKTRVPAVKAVPSKGLPKKTTTAKQSTTVVNTTLEAEDTYLKSLRSSVLVEKASSLLYKNDWSGAWQLLQEARRSSALAPNLLAELVATARSLLGQSMDQMAKDAVYSVIQESTLSFPSANSASALDKSDRFSMVKASPPGKVLVPFTSPDMKTAPQSYLENLREAREHLLEAHAMASVLGDGREVHRTLSMLQTVVILLSAASSSSRKAGLLGHPGYATCSIEMARNLTWRRESKALLSEKSSGRSALEWPEEVRPQENRRTSLSPLVDITKFQREYIDIIPQEWSVVSISLSDNKHDLCVSKLQAGQNPFVIRLPLERATSRDADSEVFNFQQGRSELLELIKKANATCHDKRDFSVKGAKTAWWAERSALDTQLKELLEKIESIWLGGFKGIFSQHQKHPALFAKFQKSFQSILDKHLPSRHQVRGKKTTKPSASKVALDDRILELFIGLGDASDEDCEFDELLNDLLYFVVDILQFHGERNAYDEIDFDTLVVDTLDALHSYHASAKAVEATDTRSHTILILDKVLHGFPWESMPCLQGLAVSRVPSLACLRRLILEQQVSSRDIEPEAPRPRGHHVSSENGTYILNPSGDLKTTQTMFEGPLSSSLGSTWKGIHNKPPSEAEFEKALESNDVVLYMGHGGGAQYIRNRQIRRLEKCRATALLMGCSSASLADVGDFEVYGLVWSYMLAGCPAVVGTLWDVTDKDIDLYTAMLYEEWGLVGRGTFQAHLAKECKSKGNDGDVSVHDEPTSVGGTRNKKERSVSRKRIATDSGSENGGGSGSTACGYGAASLPEAVARTKNAGVCKFKYLNAGAVCVYGIPVYVDRNTSERRGRE